MLKELFITFLIFHFNKSTNSFFLWIKGNFFCTQQWCGWIPLTFITVSQAFQPRALFPTVSRLTVTPSKQSCNVQKLNIILYCNSQEFFLCLWCHSSTILQSNTFHWNHSIPVIRFSCSHLTIKVWQPIAWSPNEMPKTRRHYKTLYELEHYF